MAQKNSKSKSAEFLDLKGISYQRLELERAAHTVQDVLDLCSCQPEETLKTLLFIGGTSAVIAIIDGSQRADIEKLCRATGQRSLRMAKPEEVFQITSCKVGTVSPFGITGKIEKVMDIKITKLSRIITGSGEETVLFELNSDALKSAWDGRYADIT